MGDVMDALSIYIQSMLKTKDHPIQLLLVHIKRCLLCSTDTTTHLADSRPPGFVVGFFGNICPSVVLEEVSTYFTPRS